MVIAIIGASGFLGKNLIKDLLINTKYNIVAIAPDADSIQVESEFTNRVKKIKASVFDYNAMVAALIGIDVAYYLVHMMTCNKNDFYDKETEAAEITGKAIQFTNVKRVIYMSGLGNDSEVLSNHLASRHNTGDILRKYIREVIEFRASMIVGEGSISFEIVRNIVNKSPIITLPKWAKTKTEPVGISDALLYLRNAIDIQIDKPEIIEIGGPEIMSYKEFIKKYIKFRSKHNLIFRIPILPESIAGFFLNFFTTKEQACVGQCMLNSFKNEMIVTNERKDELFPDIHPRKIEDSFV